MLHPNAIVTQLVIAFIVGQLKIFHAGEFNLKLCDLFEREMGESSMRFASKHLADEEWEGAAVAKYGLVHDLDWQSVANECHAIFHAPKRLSAAPDAVRQSLPPV